MCGRYTLTVEMDELAEHFNCPTIVPVTLPRYNIAPTQTLPVIVAEEGQRQVQAMKWGLIPFWAKDPGIGSKMINARFETLTEKAAFKYALQQRRCIVPADAYYEWQMTENGKRPMCITLPDRQLFGFAGLWEKWMTPEGIPLLSYTIITTAPADSVAHIHQRMPLILAKEQEEYWLQGLNANDSRQTAAFLAQIRPVQELVFYPISTRVNSPKNDDPQCMIPL